jgi:hypothetical protein
VPKVPKEQAPKEKPTIPATPVTPQNPEQILADPRREPEYRTQYPKPPSHKTR